MKGLSKSHTLAPVFEYHTSLGKVNFWRLNHVTTTFLQRSSSRRWNQFKKNDWVNSVRQRYEGNWKTVVWVLQDLRIVSIIAAATLSCPAICADSRAQWPAASRRSASAPASRSWRTADTSPASAAKCKAVFPAPLLALRVSDEWTLIEKKKRNQYQ